MREFRIKVNNEKTYVVKANDYNQAVKTLHSKLSDFDLTNFLALKRSLELRIGEEIDFDKLEEYVNKLPKDKNGKKNIDVKEVIKRCIKAKDNAVSDSISRYTGEDAIRTNGFVKIKEDGDWTSYKYNGSDFDGAVFKIHQYNPSLIAFVSNGNRTITVRNKYLKDSSITDTDMKTAEDIIKKYGGNPVGNVMGLQKTRFVGQDEIKNQHDFATDLDKAGYKFYLINGRYRISPKDSSIKDDLTMVEKYKKSIIYIDDNGYYYHTPIGGRGAKAQRDNTKDINIVKKRIDNDYSFLYDSSIKDVSYVSGKNLKIGQKIVEDGEVLEVVDIKETQRGVNNNYRDVTLKNVKTGATETVHFVNNALARLNDYSIKDTKFLVHAYNNGKLLEEKLVNTKVEAEQLAKEFIKKYGEYSTSIKLVYSDITDADPVKVEKIIRKEKSALGITYYIFQTKSSSGYTIYYQVTDKTYHGEPTYSGGGIISVSLKSANDTLDHNLLMDKLKAKYGEKEGTKRYLRGENDSAIKDKLSTSDANSLVEAYIDKYKYTHSNLPYVNKPKIKIFNSPEEFRDKFLSSYRGYSIYAGGLLNYNGYVVKLFTSAKDGKIESPSADNIFTIFPTTAIKDSSNIKNRISYDDLKRTINKVMEEGNDKDVVNILIGQLAELKKDYETDINNSKLDKEETKRHYGEYKRLVNNYKNSQISKEYTKAVNSFLSAIKDSDNIKNRKSYTIKVGDKQYKIFAESEEEAVDKYIKSKKQ